MHRSSNGSFSGSFSGSPGDSPAADRTQPAGRTWDFSLSERTSLSLFLVFLGCALVSLTANGLLFFLTARYKQLLWQPQYILLSNMSACGLGTTFITTCAVLSSVVREQTQVFGCWCVVQFCILRCFFLTSQMSLALMAVERYVFICHGIHYLRLINTSSVHRGLGLLWLLSLAVSVHGGLVLNQIERRLQQQTSGFMCDASSIRELLPFTLEENLQVFVPPCVIITFCILTICCCYGCMYQAALRASAALKCNNHRANCTVGLYLLMFLLQMLPSVFFVNLVVMRKTRSPTWWILTPLLTPLIFTTSPCITAAFLLVRNPQIKQLLSTMCRQKCPWTVVSEVEVLQWTVVSEVEVLQWTVVSEVEVLQWTVVSEVEVLQQSTVEHTCQDEEEQHRQGESFTHPVTPPPLPGIAQRT